MDNYENLIKPLMSEKRLSHSIGVAKTAVSLAEKFGANVDKAYTAGILHDCVKDFSIEEMMVLVDNFNIKIDEELLECEKILHGKIGAEYVKNVFGIEDNEIYDAICYHSTGRTNMSVLTKIIYISDFVEPTRDFPGVDEIRNALKKSLDEGVMFALNHTIKHLIDKNEVINSDTLNARNYMLLERREKNV